jgi:hypothetical protein
MRSEDAPTTGPWREQPGMNRQAMVTKGPTAEVSKHNRPLRQHEPLATERVAHNVRILQQHSQAEEQKRIAAERTETKADRDGRKEGKKRAADERGVDSHVERRSKTRGIGQGGGIARHAPTRRAGSRRSA